MRGQQSFFCKHHSSRTSYHARNNWFQYWTNLVTRVPVDVQQRPNIYLNDRLEPKIILGFNRLYSSYLSCDMYGVADFLRWGWRISVFSPALYLFVVSHYFEALVFFLWWCCLVPFHPPPTSSICLPDQVPPHISRQASFPLFLVLSDVLWAAECWISQLTDKSLPVQSRPYLNTPTATS